MSYQRGLSLVELMIGTTLGLVMLAALGQAMLAASRNYRMDEARARTDAEARFALAQLASDLEMAGWWGGVRGPGAVRLAATAAGLGGDCALPLQEAVRIFHERLPCISAAEYAGGDTVALQRVAADPIAASPLDGHAYLAVDGPRGMLFRHATGTAPPAGLLYEYQPSIWYLRRYTASPAESPRVPALCRKVLSGDGARMQGDTGGCIAQGIESLALAAADGEPAGLRVRLVARLREAGTEFVRHGDALVLLRNAAWQLQPAGLP